MNEYNYYYMRFRDHFTNVRMGSINRLHEDVYCELAPANIDMGEQTNAVKRIMESEAATFAFRGTISEWLIPVSRNFMNSTLYFINPQRLLIW